LYGLYKQATEGNVDGIMPRPVGFTLEDEGAKKKWDAWKREEGISKTEAKRRYISYLIETMKIYASGTLEARELLSELEYLWDQIKDLQFNSDDEVENHIPLPSHSPSFSQAQSDRYSTPSIVPNQQYRNNLQKIYSHSRRNTMLSINEYVNQQIQGQGQGQGLQLGPNDAVSLYSLPIMESKPNQPQHQQQHYTRGKANTVMNMPNAAVSAQEDFKAWQGEINLIINRLTREFVNGRRSSHPSHTPEVEEAEELDVIIKRRVLHILRIIGGNAVKFLKNFSVSLLAILFLIWLVKKNVVVQRTMVKQPSTNGKKNKKELVINMIINTDENKWFIRLLSFVNSFVGFV